MSSLQIKTRQNNLKVPTRPTLKDKLAIWAGLPFMWQVIMLGNELGEDRLREIVTSCARRAKKFENENELVRYLGGCKRHGPPSRASPQFQRITDK